MINLKLLALSTSGGLGKRQNVKEAAPTVASHGANQVDRKILNGCKKYGLHREMVEPSFREPFILKGYRKPNMTALDCFKSAFVLHCNETINIWTHLIAFLLFAAKFTSIFASELSLGDPFVWPLLSNAIGICGFCLMSVCAHMFNSVSLKGRHTCFFMDYAAISIYSFSAGQVYYFYARPLDVESRFFNCPLCFGSVSFLASIVSTTLCCATRIKWNKYRHLIRTCAYAVPYLLSVSPYVYRLVLCTTAVDCERSALTAFWTQALFAVFAALTYVSHIPERYIPGVFDIFGHSHHFMHVGVSLGAAFQFSGIRIDMDLRKDALLSHSGAATFWNSLFLMIIAVASNIAIALRFGRKSGHVELKKSE